MTSQEQQMIAGLIDRVEKTQLTEKDPDAEQMLQQGLARNPDAIYILAQTVLVQQYALEQAQRQLTAARQQQSQPPRHATSFLGGLFGHSEPASPPPPPAYQPVQTYAPATGSYTAPPVSQGSPAGVFGAAPQGGGFLRSALQTATGVAAGALAFQGIESLMHGFGGGGGAQGFGGFGDGGRPEEVVNNYYGDSGRNADSDLSPDIEDRRGDASLGSFDDTSSNTGDGDDNAFTSSDDDNTSDLGSFDDGGGDDLVGNDDSSFN